MYHCWHVIISGRWVHVSFRRRHGRFVWISAIPHGPVIKSTIGHVGPITRMHRVIWPTVMHGFAIRRSLDPAAIRLPLAVERFKCNDSRLRCLVDPVKNDALITSRGITNEKTVAGRFEVRTRAHKSALLRLPSSRDRTQRYVNCLFTRRTGIQWTRHVMLSIFIRVYQRVAGGGLSGFGRPEKGDASDNHVTQL